MDLITKNVARGMIRTIGPLKIAGMADELIKGLIAEKQKIELLPGESDIIGIVFEIEGVAHFSQAAIVNMPDGTTAITRQITTTTINELLQMVLSNL